MALPESVTLSPHVLYRKIEEETMIVDTRNQRQFVLDEISTRIWHLLAEHSQVETVIEHLLATYDVDRQTLVQHVDQFLTSLAQSGLVILEAE